MNGPTLRHLEYLIALSEEGSFSAAAQRCHVTQSTLSAGIKEAENLLGQTLINRDRRGLSLTEFAQDILPDVRAVLARCESIVLRARQYDAPMSAPIRLGIIPTIAPYFLPQILPKIHAQYPDLDIRIFEDLSARLNEDLNRGHLDLLLLALPFDLQGAEASPLFDEPFYLAQPKAQPAPKGGAYETQSLNQEELLLLADGHCLSDHALQACGLQRLAGQQRAYSASSLTTLIQMVGHGMGKTLLPQMVVQSDTLPASIAVYPFKKPQPTRTIGLAWRRGNPRRNDFLKLAALIK